MSKSSFSFPQSDRILSGVLGSVAVAGSLITFLVVFFVAREALPALQSAGILSFFGDVHWHPKERLFNLTPMLVATILSTMGAVLLAAPLGILSAIYCNYYAPAKLTWVYRRLVELIAGIPSVVFGFWGLITLVPFIARFQPPGASLLAGVLILSIMILPTMALTADSIFQALPSTHALGASALAMGKWRMIRSIVLPATRRSLFGALILQTCRALGETMAILMVCGNVVQMPTTLFDPVRTLTANMALEMSYATGEHRSALFVSGLLLVVFVIVMVYFAHSFGRSDADA